jgi:hypothetical protein
VPFNSPPSFSGPRDPGRVTLRRLNRAEYNNTIRDLLGVDFQPAKDFPADDVGYGFDNIGDVLSLPPILMEKYLSAAEQVVEQVFKSPEARRRLVLRPGRGRGGRGALRENLRNFVTRAYRRPATDDELKRLLQLFRTALDSGDNAEGGIKLVVQAVLVSPHFLFRVEHDPPERRLSATFSHRARFLRAAASLRSPSSTTPPLPFGPRWQRRQ